MFNFAGGYSSFNNYKVLGGISPGDVNSHRLMFAGPDPADSKRVLVRKVVQTAENKWCFEESRITPGVDGAPPTVHTTLHHLGHLDLKESIDESEWLFRLRYNPMPLVFGFGLFARAWEGKKHGSMTITENTLIKTSKRRWAEVWQDFQDRRSVRSYLRMRWMLNF